jgi:DNA-binding XRE family transcriptional regulator
LIARACRSGVTGRAFLGAANLARPRRRVEYIPSTQSLASLSLALVRGRFVPTFEERRWFLAMRLKARREELELSQLQLALMSEIDRTFISQIERCVGNPSLKTLCRIAEALEMPVCALVCHEGVTAPEAPS